MMKKTTLAAAIALTAGLFASSAMAVLSPAEVDGGTVNFNGKLIAAACEIDTATKDQTVSLGSVDLGALKQSKVDVYGWGTVGDQVPFKINLVKCDSQVSQSVDVTLSSASTEGWRMQNTSQDPNASNLKLMIGQTGGTGPVNTNNTGSSLPVTITDGNVSLDFWAKYTSDDVPNITPGSTLYSVTYKMNYK